MGKSASFETTQRQSERTGSTGVPWQRKLLTSAAGGETSVAQLYGTLGDSVRST